MQTFKEKVFSIVAEIPRGKTLSYGEVAFRAGSLGASRAVGNILSKNYNPNIPCHRVIRKDGGLGGYNRGLSRKKEILCKEQLSLKSLKSQNDQEGRLKRLGINNKKQQKIN